MRLPRSLLLTCLVVTAAWATSHGPEWIVGQEVRTTSGTVVGHGSCWKPLVSEYLGIRYAKPPVGDLRFAKPEPYRSRETYEAASFPNSCPSRYWRNTNRTVSYATNGGAVTEQIAGYGETFDEDCLGLSIWTKPRHARDRKAVLVFIHGGSFFSGSQAHPGYNGATLADEHDVVVVTLNYRLTVLGFPGSEVLHPNLGMLDVRLAVEWVRDNIGKFGGDPSRITLFGQSAGAKAVDAYSYGWPRDPIVHGVILQSGNVPPWKAATGRQEAVDQWYRAVKTLGCRGNAHAVVKCVRSKPWRDVVDLENLDGFRFEPIPDGHIIYADPLPQLMAGNFIRVPMLVGHTDNEAGFYEYIGADGSRAEDLTCASRIIAGSRTMAGLPAWHYTYAGTWPNQDIGTGGAYHTSDNGMVFGTHEIITRRRGLPEQRKLSWAMGNAWASFARDPYGALAKLGWPVFDIGDSASTNIVLGGERSSEIYFEHYNRWIQNCDGEKLPF